jgi:hypothetical protein
MNIIATYSHQPWNKEWLIPATCLLQTRDDRFWPTPAHREWK